MPKPPLAEKMFLEGPVGPLEAILESPSDSQISGAAVVLHPHPQFGGTMHNKVAHTLGRALVRSGFASLRFNFRGTEGSAGEFNEGVGEVDDALAAVAWMREKYPGLPFWLTGFSFGAAIAVHVATKVPVEGLISVAPAVYRFAKGLEGQPECSWLIIQGDEDELVDINETIEWVNDLGPGPEFLVVPGAEHFFHGRLIDLREAVIEFIARSRA